VRKRRRVARSGRTRGGRRRREWRLLVCGDWADVRLDMSLGFASCGYVFLGGDALFSLFLFLCTRAEAGKVVLYGVTHLVQVLLVVLIQLVPCGQVQLCNPRRRRIRLIREQMMAHRKSTWKPLSLYSSKNRCAGMSLGNSCMASGWGVRKSVVAKIKKTAGCVSNLIEEQGGEVGERARRVGGIVPPSAQEEEWNVAVGPLTQIPHRSHAVTQASVLIVSGCTTSHVAHKPTTCATQCGWEGGCKRAP
jgi:hypothetical protein